MSSSTIVERHENEFETPKMKSQVQHLPSDFSDVQPRSYDPDYISDISNRMQVPDRIAVDGVTGEGSMVNGQYGMDNGHARSMMVPDRIILMGANEHVSLRPILKQFEFDSNPSQPDMSYVNLITPPRVLTLQSDDFPTVEDSVEDERPAQRLQVQQNGSAIPVPFTPGISPNDSLLLNEEDEATLLRTQLSKLTRRVALMEQETQKRSQRELLLYPMVFSYFLFKVFSWFFRSAR